MTRIKCEACSQQADVMFGSATIPNGFMLYDSVNDCDVPDADTCERFNCPHDTRPVHFSRMLPPMGSMGEDAGDPPHLWNDFWFEPA